MIFPSSGSSDDDPKSSLVTRTSHEPVISQASHGPLLESDSLPEWLIDLRETLTYTSWFMIKDREYRWLFGWKRSIGQSMWEGVWSFQPVRVFSAWWSSRYLLLLGFLRWHDYIGVIDTWLSFQLLSPSWRIDNGAKNSKLLIMTCSFWWWAPIQKPTKHWLIRTADTPITFPGI